MNRDSDEAIQVATTVLGGLALFVLMWLVLTMAFCL
jgi:hypothetical protein